MTLGFEDVAAELDFGPRAPMRGIVAFADGTPVPAGVTVRLTRRVEGEPDERTETVTNEGGAFSSPPVLAGRYSLSAALGDPGLGAWVPRVDHDPARDEPVQVTVIRRGHIELSCDAGLDRVRLGHTTGSPRWRPVRWERLDRRSELPWDGRIRPLAPGPHVFAFEVTHPDGSVTMRPTEVMVPPGETIQVTLKEPTEPLAEFAGLVRSGATPIPGVRVTAHVEGHMLASARTDTEGRYRLLVDADGPLTLRLGDDGGKQFLEQPANARRATREELELLLPTGTVRISLGDPLVAGEEIRLRRPGGSEGEHLARHGGGQGSRAETFHFVEDGRHVVEVLDSNRAVTDAAEALVDGGVAWVRFER